jgi:hypothetical protein
MANQIIEKYLFKKDFTGKGKKPPYNDFRLIELHNSETLENTTFFVDVEAPIKTTDLKLRDCVEAAFSMKVLYGEAKLVLESLKKIPSLV